MAQVIGPGLIALNATVVFFSVLSMLLVIRALRKSFRIYTYAKRQLSMVNPGQAPNRQARIMSWSDVTLQDKLAFFNMWLVVTFLANAMMIFAAGCGIKRVKGRGLISHGTVEVERLARGMGLFLSWVSLIRWLFPC